MHPPLYAQYRANRHLIRDADALLFRKPGPIAWAGRGIHSHVEMAAWWETDLMAIGMVRPEGRATRLSHLVHRYPGRIDVYAADPDGRFQLDRRLAVEAMRAFCGERYGLLKLARLALVHTPILWHLIRTSRDDAAVGGLPGWICSEAVPAALRHGGVDPVLNLADADTEPADLSRSPLFRYRFTLVP